MGRGEGPSVLIPSPIAPPGIACTRSLGRNGVRTVVASERETDPVFVSKYCDESVVVPSPHEDLLAYKDALRSLAEREDVRAITPNREEDVYVLSKYRAEFEDHVAALWPSFETLRKVHDRTLLAEVAADAGVPAPETRLFDEVDDWDRESVVKPRYPILVDGYVDSYAPTECDPVHTVEYLKPGVEPDRDEIDAEMLGHEPIVQECVPKSEEYMVAALYDRGDPVATFQHRQIRGHSYAGGGSVFRRSTYEPRLETVARDLLDHLEWHGVACIEYMKDADTGEYKLTEINPRFWRSLPLAVRAGSDVPYYYWQTANGDADDVRHEYDLGVASHFLYGEARYLSSVLWEDHPNTERPAFGTAVWDVLTSCLEDPQFDYLRADDPLPFARALLNSARGST